MLHKTNGIVLRSIKYGESSLVTTIFTSAFGIQAYIVQGVRGSKSKLNRAGYFQPGTLLELLVYCNPKKNLQRISQFQAGHIYNGLPGNVVKNSIVLFSSEMLLRLLPEQGPLPALFNFVYEYFITLDKTHLEQIANFPLFFIIQCSRELGFDLKGSYSAQTPHLNLQEGGFTDKDSIVVPAIYEEDVIALDALLKIKDYDTLKNIQLTSAIRLRLTDWFIAFLQLHTEHMGNIKSLAVLRMILH